MKYYLVELAHEFAKEVVYLKMPMSAFENQSKFLGEQYDRMHRLIGSVDIIVTDSPIILNEIYSTPDQLPGITLLVDAYRKKFQNIDIFLKRNKPYVNLGRNQTEDEAKSIDVQIKNLLLKKELPYIEILSDKVYYDKLLEGLENLFNQSIKQHIKIEYPLNELFSFILS
jgi:hypothetical protein